jgi:heme-degrading monooxygenase HmoA
VFIRIWRTDFDVSRLDELQSFADETSAEMFGRLPGCLGYIYAVAGSTWITQTFWESEQDIRDAEDSTPYRDVVSRLVSTGVLGDNQDTEVFEITGYAS